MTAENEIFADIFQIVTEVIGEDFLLDVEVGPDTTLHWDLALESIEFVALVEKLQQRYGEGIDLMGFFAGMNLDQVIELTVGELAAYIESRLHLVGPEAAVHA